MLEERQQDAARCKAWLLSRHGYLPRTWWLDPSWVAVRLTRLACQSLAQGHSRRARFFVQLNAVLTGADVEPDSKIGPGLLLTNPLGVSLWIDAGCDLTFDTLAGSGNTMRHDQINRKPRAGDRVTFNAFAGAQGPITLGDDVRLSPGAGAFRSIVSGQWSYQHVPKRHTIRDGTRPEPRACHLSIPDLPRCSLRRTLRHWRDDIDRVIEEAKRFAPDATPGRLSTALLNQSIALLVHRVAHFCHCRRLNMLARAMSGINRWIFKLTISPEASLGPGVWLPHLAGTIVHARTGQRLSAFAQTCVMPSHGPFAQRSAAPELGDDVLVAAHAGAFGAVQIGAEVQLSRKTNAIEDVAEKTSLLSEAASFIAGPARHIPVREEASFSLPPWSLTRKSDFQRRKAFEAAYGALPLQSRLAVWLFRRAQFALAKGHLRVSRAYWLVSRYLTGADIAPRSQIAPGLVIVCAPGVSFDGAAGEGLVLVGQCFVGGVAEDPGRAAQKAATPSLGANITIPPHTVIYGGCTLGSNIQIDPGVTIFEDVPEGYQLSAPKIRKRIRRDG